MNWNHCRLSFFAFSLCVHKCVGCSDASNSVATGRTPYTIIVSLSSSSDAAKYCASYTLCSSRIHVAMDKFGMLFRLRFLWCDFLRWLFRSLPLSVCCAVSSVLLLAGGSSCLCVSILLTLTFRASFARCSSLVSLHTLFASSIPPNASQQIFYSPFASLRFSSHFIASHKIFFIDACVDGFFLFFSPAFCLFLLLSFGFCCLPKNTIKWFFVSFHLPLIFIHTHI